MDEKLAGSSSVGKIADVDASIEVELVGDKESEIGWNSGFLISIDAIVMTTRTAAIVYITNVDAVIGVELD